VPTVRYPTDYARNWIWVSCRFQLSNKPHFSPLPLSKWQRFAGFCDRIDYDAMLRSIGRMDFSVAPGRGDGASHGGGPDPRDPTFPHGRTLASPPFVTVQEQQEILRIRSHDFH
jgi:hypothetical protein